ncbi:outer membrane beta-barrel family protein [uncultured Aquimarina sp.]|uniref:outer membrane beta-barrel family protein n=1 Tax=uncultured Aquimarina sp. TaxID=575652 RepID=UPI002618CB32|nr:outer membrane beta-barrel family protein [uncultured Aquimarina sp.]
MKSIQNLIASKRKKIIKDIALVLPCLFFVSLLSAQTAIINGKILDNKTKEPLPYVNVIIKKEGKITTGGITNDNGFFSIKKIPYGNYMIAFQYIGYNEKELEVNLSANKKTIDLGNIAIVEDALSLDAVEITAERSTIEQKIDRKVINVGKDLTTTGASASDIMNNIPSVSINQEGGVSFRGNDNVRILVDGKPTNIDPRDLLQQIPTTSIKTIELITNPSAKYNPEGMSGIINITLKKNANLGLNGSVNLGFTNGERSRYNNALNLNYNNKKINAYGNYGNRFGDRVTNGTVTRTIEETNQLTKNINNQTSHLIKVGLDYFIDNKNTFSIYTNQNIAKRQSDGKKDISFFTAPEQNFNQLDDLNTETLSASYNVDYKHIFSDNHSLELEADYNRITNEAANAFSFFGNTPINNYQETIDDNRNNTVINLDYENAINENSNIELGLETRINSVENSYVSDRIDFRNSNFNFDRNIYSFYSTFSQKWEKLQYNIGLRLERYNTDNKFIEVGDEANTFSDKQFNIYPSGFLKYTPNENGLNSYQLSFSRRVDRPSLNQINPIRQISTPQIILKGNPNLLPQFTNSVELNYTRKQEGGSLTFGGFYRRISDEINRRGFFDDETPTVLILDYANFDSTNAFGFEFSTNYKVNDWWRYNGSVDIYTRKQKGIIENEEVEVKNTLFNIKISNSFKATEKLSFQLFTLYSGKQRVLQYELKDNFFMNAGARYNFAKGKGTINLNFNDIFKTQRFAFNAFRTIIQEGEFRQDSQSVYLGLSYRFGIKNKNIKRKKRDANEKKDKFL